MANDSNDDPRIDPIWAKCGELGIPVMIHSSDPKAFHDGPVDKYNERYEELIANPAWAYFNTNIPSKGGFIGSEKSSDRTASKYDFYCGSYGKLSRRLGPCSLMVGEIS